MVENKENIQFTDSINYRPFTHETGPNITISTKQYATSLDPRGFIPVYEYQIDSIPIMWDRETGHVHFTGIWKALGNPKSDIAKMVDSNIEIKFKKIRGGYLHIQGTWIPFNDAYDLCKRTAWKLRHDLFPLFGPKFADDALPPSHPHHGSLVLCGSTPSGKSIANGTPTVRKKLAASKLAASKLASFTSKKLKNQKKSKRASCTKSPIKKRSTRVTAPTSSFPSPVPTTTYTAVFPPSPEPAPMQAATVPWLTLRVEPAHPTTDTHDADIIQMISASILLQHLSQDDGARPFRPLLSHGIPSRVIVGQQEFMVCWD